MEYIELKPIQSKRMNHYIKLSTILYNFTITNNISNIPKTAIGFKIQSKKKHDQLIEEGVNLTNLLENLKNSRKVLIYGDIHKKNVFQNLIVIDWDGCGMYPIGFEPANLFYKRTVGIENFDTDVFKWIENNYKSEIQENDWKDFKQNFAYYVLAKSTNIFQKTEFSDMKNQLITLANSKNSSSLNS